MALPLNPSQQAVRSLYFDAKVYETDQAAEIEGHSVALTLHMVNRKCFDFTPTPTVIFQLDGKRISYNNLLAFFDLVLADMIRNGATLEEVLNTREADRWPGTYCWLKDYWTDQLVSDPKQEQPKSTQTL